MGDPLVVDLDHHSSEFLANRLAEWRKLRQTPVAYTNSYGGFWVVSGYREVTRVSRDDETFTGQYGEYAGVDCRGIVGIPRPEGLPAAGIAEAEAGVHQALRRALNPYLLPNAVDAMRPWVEDLTTWFIDQRIETGAMDMVNDLTNPVPAVATMRLLGLPCDGWKHYADLFHATIAFREGEPEQQAAVANVPAMVEALLEEVEERRRRPRPDLLTELVQIEGRDGKPVSDAEITAVLWNLVGGGLDTTTSLTALSLHHLYTHPDLRRRLIADPGLLSTATEEFLRYFSVNETLTRTVTKEVELGGQRMCPGDVVLLSWLSANHDESQFDRPGEVVLERSPNKHLGFGIGPHRCIGMHLARMQFQVMMRAVLDRLPDYELDLDATRFYEGNPTLAGVVSMPSTFTPGPRKGTGRRPF
jgi:cytochrome P450